MTCTDVDVVIAGTGPAGSATAVQLARAGWRVAMLEKRAATRFTVGETIAPFAKRILAGVIGRIPDPLPNWASPVLGTQSIWGASELAFHDNFFGPYGPGLCVNRDGLDAAVRSAAINAGAESSTGVAVRQATYDAKNAVWTLDLDGRQGAMTAHYLVDASGRAGAIGRMLGHDREQGDPLFSFALLMRDTTQGQSAHATSIEACDYGWWYSNRLPGKAADGSHGRIVMLQTDPDTAAAQDAKTETGFIARMSQTKLMSEFVGAPMGKIRGAPAGNSRSHHITAPGFVAVGDAAQSFDPLSSQGMQQALLSGQQAGQAIAFALANPNSTDPYLEHYAQQRQAEWDKYITQYQKYYQLEARWPSSSFWQTRQSQQNFSQPVHARDAS